MGNNLHKHLSLAINHWVPRLYWNKWRHPLIESHLLPSKIQGSLLSHQVQEEGGMTIMFKSKTAEVRDTTQLQREKLCVCLSLITLCLSWVSSPNSEADGKDTVNSPPIVPLEKREREKLQLSFPQLLQLSQSEGGAHHTRALSITAVGFEHGRIARTHPQKVSKS